MKLSEKWLLGTGLALLTVSMPAMAQEETTDTPEVTRKLNTVTVTAQKREESLQDVSVSVSAYSTDTMRQIGLTNTNDLGLLMPNVEIVAPFGLEDLFTGVVRPNKALVTRDVYENKIARWRRIWPDLTYLPWSETE